MERIAGTPFKTKPAVGFSLDPGLSYMHKDRFGLNVNAGLVYNGNFYRRDSVKYRLHHITQRLELQPFWLVPLGYQQALRIGLGMGRSYQGAGSFDHQEGEFKAYAWAERTSRPYWAPELGYMVKMGGLWDEIGFRFVRHVGRDPLSRTLLSLGPDTSLASTVHDHFAIVLRAHFNPPKSRLPRFTMNDTSYASRMTDTLTTIRVSERRIVLRFWDDSEEDGDVISILLNGEPILVAEELTRKRKKIRADLERGENILLIVAENEGRIPPNTVRVQVSTGAGWKNLLVKTSLQKNQAVRIERLIVPRWGWPAR